MTTQSAPGGAGHRGKAEELMAAVRAVESGERTADSFFSRPAPATRPPRRAEPARPPTAVSGPPAAVPVPGELVELLASGGAPGELAGPVAALLGEGAARMLREDPWALLLAPGVLPAQADGFARSLLGDGCGPGDPRRCRALVGLLLERAARRGHTVLEPAELCRGLAGHGVPDPEAALREAVESGAALLFEDPVPGAEPDEDGAVPVRPLVGLDRVAAAEESLADGLARLTATFRAPAQEEVRRWEQAAAGTSGPSAGELVRAAAGHGLVAHSGGEAARAEPAALLAAAAGLGLRCCATAHTVHGAARFSALMPGQDGPGGGVDVPVVALADLLVGRAGPARDAEGLWPLDLLVLTDGSLLGTEEAAAVVEALPDGARLVLSGDPALLGPVGPGRVLGDLLTAGGRPAVISRTPDPGPIGELVSGVGAGELAEVAAPGKEVVVVPVADGGEAVHRAVQLVTESVPRAFGMAAEEVQVITPLHGGAAGTGALNAALKARLNPGPGRFGGFDPGDRVLHSPSPGHGRPGLVSGADDTGLRLECDGETVTVPRERVTGTVRHGWALTAHQAAGRRWPAAVVVVPGDTLEITDRSWVYTAFGRGERHLSVVQGAGAALQGAVSATPPPRRTRLPELLRQAAQTR